MTVCIRRARSTWTTCPCDTCHTDRLRMHKRHSTNTYRRVPNDTAWAILAARIDADWTARAIGSATGLGSHYFTRHLAQYRKGRRVYLGPQVAAAIMRIGTPTEGQVGAEPSRRRLRALAAIGHGLNTIEAETGIRFSTLAAIRNDAARRTGAAVANQIAAAYDRLHMTIGADEQAQRIAREKKWPAPIAWDDIDTDPKPTGTPGWRGQGPLPAGHVDHAVVDLLINGTTVKANTAERHEAMRTWLAMGNPGRTLSITHGWKEGRYMPTKDVA